MCVRQANVRGGEVRIGVDGLLEVLRRRTFFVVTDAPHSSSEVVVAPKICVESLRVCRPRPAKRFLALSPNLPMDSLNDLLCQVSLEREGIAHVALVAIGP